MDSTFGVPHWLTGVIIMVLAGAVILGGIKRIAKVAGKLVPIMGIAYVIAGLLVLIVNASQIGEAFGLIFYYAFNPMAAAGGFAGAAVMAAIGFGVARGIFSNEAGLGSAPIAHAAAQTKTGSPRSYRHAGHLYRYYRRLYHYGIGYFDLHGMDGW